MSGIIYLAAPYSHLDPKIMEQRFDLINEAAATLMKRGLIIFSPISHTHPIAQYGLPKGWEFWRKYDIEFVEICKELMILKLPGWEESRGVTAEEELATAKGIPVTYVEPRDVIEGWAEREKEIT